MSVDLLILFWPSIVTGLAIGLAGAVIGTIVLLRREALLALALPQVASAGAASGMVFLSPIVIPESLHIITDHLGWPTMPAVAAAVALALLLLAGARRRKLDHLLLPCLFVAGLSMSFLAVAHAGQHLSAVQNLLTGVDVAVDVHVAEVVSPALIIIALAVAVLWRRWLLIAQAPATAMLAGLRPAWWDAGFLACVGAVVILSTSAIGVVMVVAMLFLPAAIALPWCNRVPHAMWLGAGVSQLMFAIGFVASVQFDLPLSHAVAAVGVLLVAGSHALARLRGPQH